MNPGKLEMRLEVKNIVKGKGNLYAYLLALAKGSPYYLLSITLTPPDWRREREAVPMQWSWTSHITLFFRDNKEMKRKNEHSVESLFITSN
jgi:hypothetical protein